MAAARRIPLYRGQGNEPFITADSRSAAKRGQTVPYDINGAPTGASGAAADISFTPAGSVAATDVQAAIEEIDTEKVASASLPELVQDLVGAMLANGANITVTYDDATGASTIAVTGTLPAARMPAFTGDVTSAAGSVALTLATVNLSPGAYGGASKSLAGTVNAKGLVTSLVEQAIAITSGQITDFTEAAQDALGAMVDTSLVYVDATPLLTRAALTGDATAAQGSNALTLATVNSNIGTFGSATKASAVTVNAKGLVTAASEITVTPAWASITGTPTTLAGYGITDAQPLDSDLTTIAGLTATTDNFIVSVASAWASRTPAQVRTTLGLVIGTNVQAYDADLTTWAGITPGTGVATALAVNVGSAGAFVTFNGALGTPSSGTLTNATGLPIAGLVASTVTAIGVGSVELGHASDTTLARSSAGNVTIEGNAIYRAGGTDVPVADGGSGVSTITGLIQGNGTSAFTAITNSTTVGQVLRVTGSNAYGWGALDLADTDAVTGTLAIARLPTGTSGAAIPVLNGAATTWGAGATFAGAITNSATGGFTIGNTASVQRIDGTGGVFSFIGADNDYAGILAKTIDVDGEARCNSLRVDQAPVAATPTPTHTFTISLNGTTYRIPCVV